jgi:acetyl esterase
VADADPRVAMPIRRYAPSDEAANPPGPTLLWLHGGGFFRGSLDQPEADSVAQALAGRGVAVATAHYRLAPLPGTGWTGVHPGQPRARFPVPLDDVLDAYRTVSAGSPQGVILGGASAGACLAAAATLRAIDDGSPPVGTVFAYGFFHAEHPRLRDARQRSRGHRRLTHSVWALNAMNRNYAGSREALADRYAFVGGQDLRMFPRTLVINAQQDNMRASGDQFAGELAASGVDVRHHVVEGTRHGFLNCPALDQFEPAISLIAAWIRDEKQQPAR